MKLKMKSAKILIAIAATLSSCSSEFIDLHPIADQNAGSFYRNANEMEQAVTAAYDALQSGYTANRFDHFMEVASDNSYNDNTTQNGGEFANFDNFNLSSGNSVLNSAWSICYQGVQRCNIVLNRIDGISDMDAATRTIRTGETKFLRALNYFNIVRIWGDAPLVLHETSDPFEGFTHQRNPAAAIYEQVLKDLQEAVKVLPSEPAQAGRATKGAAQTLLGKVYLTLGRYDEAAAILQEVISSNQYQLLTSFKEVFDENNKNNRESVFEIQFRHSTNGEGNNSPDPNAGFVNNRPSPNIITLFESNPDDRFGASVRKDNMGLYYSGKSVGIKGTDGTYGFNTIVLRYADVLLMASEALNELGYNRENAFGYLNQVRNRANAAPYAAGDLPDQESFREALAKERRLELAFENHRWFDLLRTGKALEAMQAANKGVLDPLGGSALNFSIQAHQLLFPVPQAQIDASGKVLTQNTGY